MPTPPANGHATQPVPAPRAGSDERPQTLAELIGEAEQLRNVILDASSRLSRLLSGLKQQRRKSRAMQTAMQSLKQLKLDG